MTKIVIVLLLMLPSAAFAEARHPEADGGPMKMITSNMSPEEASRIYHESLGRQSQ